MGAIFLGRNNQRFDIGLGIFTVVGVKARMPYNNLFLSVFVGVLTGVGGEFYEFLR